MIIITDSGCHNHEPCQIAFSGAGGLMVERLIANLPVNGTDFSYICEYGHTHLLMPPGARQEIALSSMGYDKFTPEMLIDLMA